MASLVLACGTPCAGLDAGTRPDGAPPRTTDADAGDAGAGDAGPPDEPPDEAIALLHELAVTLCASRAGCTCSTPGYPSEEECVDTLMRRYRALHEPSIALGLHADLACIGAAIDAAHETEGCSPLSDATWCGGSCPFYYGDQFPGDACTLEGPPGSRCTRGSLCQGGTCLAFCSAEVGGACPNFTECGPGTVCDVEDTMRCVPIVPLGAPCTDRFRECGDRAYCSESTRLCTALPGLGEACGDGRRCRQGAECDDAPAVPVCVAAGPPVICSVL